jgi:hypothetical protein
VITAELSREFRLDDPVTLADGGLKAGTIGDRDAATAVVDQAAPAKRRRWMCGDEPRELLSPQETR